MNYKKALNTVKETTLSSGSTFGTAPNIGNQGGNVGNVDFYAPGDSRNLWGWSSSKKKKGKKKSKNPIPLYRRSFVEMLAVENNEANNTDDVLDCVIYSNTNYTNVLKHILEHHQIEYIINSKDFTAFQETNENIRNIVHQFKNIITEEPFESGEVTILIGDKVVSPIKNATVSKYFKTPKKSIEEYDQEQLKIGIKIEMEHTSSKEVATNIACNHLDEQPLYYVELKKMEKKLKSAE